jgi:hypothetical protein
MARGHTHQHESHEMVSKNCIGSQSKFQEVAFGKKITKVSFSFRRSSLFDGSMTYIMVILPRVSIDSKRIIF